jgi:hypothetical protein
MSTASEKKCADLDSVRSARPSVSPHLLQGACGGHPGRSGDLLFEHSGHFPFLEGPELFLGAVGQFFSPRNTSERRCIETCKYWFQLSTE